jgi:hypothetical protein
VFTACADHRSVQSIPSGREPNFLLAGRVDVQIARVPQEIRASLVPTIPSIEARAASAPKRVVGLPRRYSVAPVAARHTDTGAKSVTMSIGEVVLVGPPVRDHMQANRMT